MKKCVVELKVTVTCEVPDHIYAKDKAEAGDMSESDIWHDYAVGVVSQQCDTLHGPDKNNEEDWVKLFAEVTDCEIEEGPDDE